MTLLVWACSSFLFECDKNTCTALTSNSVNAIGGYLKIDSDPFASWVQTKERCI